MLSPYLNGSHRKIAVTVLTKFSLNFSCLRILLKAKSRSINTVNFVGSSEELLKLVSKSSTSIILICMTEESEAEFVKVIPELLAIAPESKILVLLPPTGSGDQTELLKLGISGIVGAEQREEVLIRAVQQVSEGGVWLSQKIIAQLLSNGDKPKLNGSNNRSSLGNDSLTARELEVIKEIGKGFSNKEISDKLFISEATVRHHLSSIYGKLQVEDRLNLVIYAFQNEIIKCTFVENA